MITLLCVFIAAIANSIMDRVENEVEINESIFSRKDPKFWLKSVSWRYARKIIGWKADVWHIAKSVMVISMCFGLPILFHVGSYLLDKGISLAIYGTVWNMTFSLFYSKIFKK